MAMGFDALIAAEGKSNIWMFDGQFDLSGGAGGQRRTLPTGASRRYFYR